MATLLELKTQVRQRADMVNSQFISDSELTSYINGSYGELYDLLVASFDDYFIADPISFTLAGSTDTQTLPADFYKLRGVDYSDGNGNWLSLYSYNFAQRNEQQRPLARLYRGRGLSYRVLGNKIFFQPSSDCAGNYRLWYIPRVTKLVLDIDQTVTLDWDEYTIVDAAIKCLNKEESDTRMLMAEKKALKERIEAMSADRDATSPEVVADVAGSNFSFNGDWSF